MAEPFYLKIRGGRIVNAWGSVTADVAIRDGRIAAIGEDMPAAQETIDAGGALILPGIVDAHAHCNGGTHHGGLAVLPRLLHVSAPGGRESRVVTPRRDARLAELLASGLRLLAREAVHQPRRALRPILHVADELVGLVRARLGFGLGLGYS